MIIQRIEISNFRSLRSVDIDCGDLSSHESQALVAILGRNGGGKSSILYALDIFYDVGARVTKEDCYCRDASNEIMIRVTYGNLRQEERDEFATYIENDRLIVTKRIQVGTGAVIQKYYAAAKAIPKFAELRRLGKSDRTKQFKELVVTGTFEGLQGTVKSADQVNEILAAYENNHSELLETVEREEQFFGPKEVGGGKLDKFTKFVLVPAVRFASMEAQRKGAIYELIDLIVLRRINKREDVRALRQEMKEKIENVFSQENLTELADLGSSISQLLKQYAPGASLKLSWGDPVTPEIPLPPANADLVEDDFPCNITHAGHGLQRALILTLLQHLAMTEPPVEDEESPEHELGAVNDSPRPPVNGFNPDLILAIEEPELYLHPSRCRHLSELLLNLSKVPKEAGSPRNQIIYATHSPYFVDLHRFDQVRIARKPRVEGHPAPCCVISQYSLEAAAKELARIASGDPTKFTRDSFRARSLPVMTTAVNEGFFASVVVVVEGLSEYGVLWKVQEKLGENWSARGITVVPAMGKQNLDRPVVVFRGLQIPTYFVFDGDRRHKNRKDVAETIDRNKRYQRLAGSEPIEFPDTQVHETWASFADDMEAVIKEAVGQEFDAIAQQAVKELKYEDVSRLMKNAEGASHLVDLIYQAGHRIPVIEDIVKKVTAMHQPIAKATQQSPAKLDVKVYVGEPGKAESLTPLA